MLKILLGVCALLSQAMQAAPTKPDAKLTRQLYEQAAKAIASADSRAAIEPLEELIEAQPSGAVACVAAVHLAECYVATDRPRDAIELLSKWTERICKASHLTNSDADLEAHHYRVWLQASKRVDDARVAIDSLETVVQRLESKTDSDSNLAVREIEDGARVELARRLAALNKYESAAAQISELSSSASSALDADVRLLHAMIYQQVGDHEAARKRLQSLLDDGSRARSQVLARLELASYAMQERDVTVAATLLAPVIDMQPFERGLDKAMDCRFKLLWSELELTNGKAARALEVLPTNEQLQTLEESQQVAVRFSRAEAAAQVGKHTLALSELDWLNEHARHAAAQPRWATSVGLRQGEMLLKTKNYKRLSEAVAEAKTRFADFERLHEFDYLQARAAMLQVDFDEARKHLRMIIELPETKDTLAGARAQWMLGETYFLEQNLMDAIAAYKPVTELTELQPWQTLALMQTAKCYELQNQFDEARGAYKQVIAVTKDEKIRQEANSRIEVIERTSNRTQPRPLR